MKKPKRQNWDILNEMRIGEVVTSHNPHPQHYRYWHSNAKNKGMRVRTWRDENNVLHIEKLQ